MSCGKDKSPAMKKIENLPNKDKWVIFNIQLAGLYKVKYDRRNYKLIVKELNSDGFKEIHIINRAQLIDDAMDLAWTGEQDYGIAFAMINYLSREHEYIPWKSALDNLRGISRLLIRSPVFGVYKAYIQHILEPIYEKVGGVGKAVESSRLDAVKHQTLICAWACRYSVGDCEEKSSEIFAQWMVETEPDHINP
jgi:aminopeptidase N